MKTALVETKENISEYRNDSKQDFKHLKNAGTTKITFTSGCGKQSSTSNVISTLRYEFSKLRERHPIFGIDYFIDHFQNDPELKAELQHLKLVYNDDCEFYCSIE